MLKLLGTEIIKPLGHTYQSVPLYNLFINSSLIDGKITVGVIPYPPSAGIDMLLGNDLFMPKNKCETLIVKSEVDIKT